METKRLAPLSPQPSAQKRKSSFQKVLYSSLVNSTDLILHLAHKMPKPLWINMPNLGVIYGQCLRHCSSELIDDSRRK